MISTSWRSVFYMRLSCPLHICVSDLLSVCLNLRLPICTSICLTLCISLDSYEVSLRYTLTSHQSKAKQKKSNLLRFCSILFSSLMLPIILSSFLFYSFFEFVLFCYSALITIVFLSFLMFISFLFFLLYSSFSFLIIALLSSHFLLCAF